MLSNHEQLRNESRHVVQFAKDSGIDTSAPKCNLCEDIYLFVVSIGGRTGSTSVLNLLNALPNVRLAGENRGQINIMDFMLERTAVVTTASGHPLYCDDPNNASARCAAFQRGSISPLNILCDLAEYFKDIAVPALPLLPAPAVNVRGFKDIAWTKESLMLLDTLFPCSKLVYSVYDTNLADAIHDYRTHFHMENDKAREAALEDHALYSYVRGQHHADIALGNSWKSFWLPRTNLTVDGVNSLLAWLGLRNCTYEQIIHANTGPGGYNVKGATIADARRYLRGDCLWPFS